MNALAKVSEKNALAKEALENVFAHMTPTVGPPMLTHELNTYTGSASTSPVCLDYVV